MVSITHKFRRIRQVTEISTITVNVPSWFNPAAVDDVFFEHAKRDPDIAWTQEETEITYVAKVKPDDEDDEEVKDWGKRKYAKK